MNAPRALQLGSVLPLDGAGDPVALTLPTQHLLTHGVVVGMTGSGKTGLVTVLMEEALRSGVPVLAIDVKGDLPDLLLAFPSFEPAEFAPWVASEAEGRPAADLAAQHAAARRDALERSATQGRF